MKLCDLKVSERTFCLRCPSGFARIELRIVIALLAILPVISSGSAATASAADPGSTPFIRIGLVGLDTSHVIAFTSMLNDATHREHVPGARVVAGFKGGSPDIAASASRVEGYAEQLKSRWKVEIVPSIPDLCGKVDGVLLTSGILYAVMGKGCGSVTRVSTPDTDLVVGFWSDGRIGTFRGTRSGLHDYGATVFGTKSNCVVRGHSMKGLVEEIVKFFQTNESPVDPQEALEVIAFMEAAEASQQQGGKAAPLPSIH